MSDQYFPPWNTTSEETSVPAGPMFRTCEHALEAFVSRTNETIAEKRYFLSTRWGHILRARLVSPGPGSPPATLLNCWSLTGSDARMAVKVETDES